MNEQFKGLLETVEVIKNRLEEREKLELERQETRNEAETYISKVVKEYMEKETNMQQQIDAANRENEKNRAEVTKLIREQIVHGEGFAGSDRLAYLKGEIATHQLKIETMEQLKNEIVLSADIQEQLTKYKSKEIQKINEICEEDNKIIELLQKIRDEQVLNCLACIDTYVTQRRTVWATEKYSVINKMRKEITK